ncbi:MAG: hypothetical protein MPK62_01880 [Alphaproteobacteria bacterium]|nr:hypothetical protein [Alphaproteobacteria bacterium]MDA8029883.1 hypothetical protein [Alphaproteobacteria bacterium]
MARKPRKISPTMRRQIERVIRQQSLYDVYEVSFGEDYYDDGDFVDNGMYKYDIVILTEDTHGLWKQIGRFGLDVEDSNRKIGDGLNVYYEVGISINGRFKPKG